MGIPVFRCHLSISFRLRRHWLTNWSLIDVMTSLGHLSTAKWSAENISVQNNLEDDAMHFVIVFCFFFVFIFQRFYQSYGRILKLISHDWRDCLNQNIRPNRFWLELRQSSFVRIYVYRMVDNTETIFCWRQTYDFNLISFDWRSSNQIESVANFSVDTNHINCGISNSLTNTVYFEFLFLWLNKITCTKYVSISIYLRWQLIEIKIHFCTITHTVLFI